MVGIGVAKEKLDKPCANKEKESRGNAFNQVRPQIRDRETRPQNMRFLALFTLLVIILVFAAYWFIIKPEIPQQPDEGRLRGKAEPHAKSVHVKSIAFAQELDIPEQPWFPWLVNQLERQGIPAQKPGEGFYVLSLVTETFDTSEQSPHFRVMLKPGQRFTDCHAYQQRGDWVRFLDMKRKGHGDIIVTIPNSEKGDTLSLVCGVMAEDAKSFPTSEKKLRTLFEVKQIQGTGCERLMKGH